MGDQDLLDYCSLGVGLETANDAQTVWVNCAACGKDHSQKNRAMRYRAIVTIERQ